MSKYTIELRKVCDLYTREEVENWFKDYDISYYLRPDEIASIESAGLWNKDRLAKKIVDHYYMREIGLETPALFKHYAKVYMQEIMETKLPLIYSISIKYDPLVNVDYTETFTRNIESNGNSSNNASGLSVASDTPQGQIQKSAVLSGAYASSTGASETESSSTDSNNTEENYSKRMKGNSGVSATAQKMIEQYRQNIVAVDRDIIEELNKLFMGLY